MPRNRFEPSILDRLSQSNVDRERVRRDALGLPTIAEINPLVGQQLRRMNREQRTTRIGSRYTMGTTVTPDTTVGSITTTFAPEYTMEAIHDLREYLNSQRANYIYQEDHGDYTLPCRSLSASSPEGQRIIEYIGYNYPGQYTIRSVTYLPYADAYRVGVCNASGIYDQLQVNQEALQNYTVQSEEEQMPQLPVSDNARLERLRQLSEDARVNTVENIRARNPIINADDGSAFFNVKLCPAMADDNDYLVQSNWWAVLREDTRTVLHIHKHRFNLEPYQEIFGRLDHILVEALEVDDASVTNELPYNGARCVRIYKFPKHRLRLSDDILLDLALIVRASYDASWAFSILPAIVNTKTGILHLIGDVLEVRRNSNANTLDFDSLRIAIQNIKKAFTNSIIHLRHLISSPVISPGAVHEVISQYTSFTARVRNMMEGNFQVIAMDATSAATIPGYEEQESVLNRFYVQESMYRWAQDAPVRAGSEDNQWASRVDRMLKVYRTLEVKPL